MPMPMPMPTPTPPRGAPATPLPPTPPPVVGMPDGWFRDPAPGTPTSPPVPTPPGQARSFRDRLTDTFERVLSPRHTPDGDVTRRMPRLRGPNQRDATTAPTPTNSAGAVDPNAGTQLVDLSAARASGWSGDRTSVLGAATSTHFATRPGTPPPGGPTSHAAAPAGDDDAGGHRGTSRRRAPGHGARPATAGGDSRTLGMRIASGAAEGMLTLGIIVVLFLIYQLWWTNVVAERQKHVLDKKIRQQVLTPHPGTLAPSNTPIGEGDPIGFMYIPKIHQSELPLLQGTGDKELASDSVGHYDNTALPWQQGNFAVAAHRDYEGEAFRYLNNLSPGDHVILETGHGWYVYVLDKELPAVSPSDVGVIGAVPQGGPYTAAGHYITLTTCTPPFQDYDRLIWFGHLVQTLPYGAAPPAAMKGS
jgi:sortase A